MKRTSIFYSCIMLVSIFALLCVSTGKAGARAYQKIINSGTIKVGISKHYPPLNFNAGKRGVDIEIAKALGKFLGVKVKCVPLEVPDYIPAMASEKVDILIAGLSRNLERGKKIWFSEPYLTLTPGVLVNNRALPQIRMDANGFEEEPFNTLWDLKRMNRFKIAVKKRSSYEYLINEKMPQMTCVYVKTNKQGLKYLKEGRVEGFVHDSLYLEYLYNSSAEYRSSYRLLKGGRQVEKIAMGLPFGDVILKTQIDLFVSEIIRKGLVDEWLEKYNR